MHWQESFPHLKHYLGDMAASGRNNGQVTQEGAFTGTRVAKDDKRTVTLEDIRERFGRGDVRSMEESLWRFLFGF
jgi:hypothetical protein